MHENIEECSPSARPSPAALTAALSVRHGCRVIHGVQIPVVRQRGWRPRAVITTLHPKRTFMNAGSVVPLASAVQARAIHQRTVIWTYCQSTLLQTSHPKLIQIELTPHPKTTSCQHKLATPHQLSVECPWNPSQTHSCSKKPHWCASGHESTIHDKYTYELRRSTTYTYM